MKWPKDATGWPLRDHSRIVLHRPHRWHIQDTGKGETLLLIHGAGGATQSWRNLFPILAENYHVVAVDLPGQGFTQSGAQQRCGLDHMATDLLSLVRNQGWQPKAVIGHSAGAAIALRMVELGLRPDNVIGLNAALGNFKGVAGWLFPAMAKVLAITPFSASLFAASTTRSSVKNLLNGTGSPLDAEGAELYYRLAKDKAHVDATLSMMAQWSLDGLLERLPQITTPVHLITAADDKAVPPHISKDAVQRLPNGSLNPLDSFGHLAHEEDAGLIAEAIVDVLK